LGLNFLDVIYHSESSSESFLAKVLPAIIRALMSMSVWFSSNTKCMVQTGDAAVQLGEKGALEVLGPALKKLATKHVTAGVADAHFEVR
jgi:hypothetical protein